MKWMTVLGLLVLAVVGLRLTPEGNARTPRPRDGTRVAAAVSDAVGTTGTHSAAHARAAEIDEGNVVTEIETITGANDGMMLVGRRVDLHVDVQKRVSDHAFWVGSADNRVLVVLVQDDPRGPGHHQGRLSRHQIVPVHRGQRAAIAGVIRSMPKPGQLAGWRLTRDDVEELTDRKIYIRADSVSSEGHGHH